jgi:PAS domain S-box-containing protein
MRSPDDFFFEKDLALVGSRVAEVYEKGTSSVEAEFRLKNGQGIPYFFTGVRFERDGKLGFVGLGIDISQRKAVEEALRRSEAHLRRERVLLRAVIDNIPDHIFFKDANFAFLGCNPTFQNYYHRPESELIGKTDFDLLPADWAMHYRKLDEQIIATGKLLRSEESVPHEGRMLTFESIRVPFYDPNGSLLGLLGVGRDITERKAMEEQLREKTALFEAQVESSLDGIMVVDRNGKRLLQNRRWNAIWKIDSDSAAGLEEPAAFYLEQLKDPASFVAQYARLKANPEEIARDTFELVDGTVLDRYSAPVLDREGRYYGRTWILRDITEERRREQRLRQAQQMEAIGNFAAGVAHDFNNVLTVIRFRAELLAEHAGSPEENAPPILRATARGRDLVEQILHFATQRHMVREPMELGATVAEAVTLLRGATPDGIAIALELPDVPARVFGNATQLLRLVLNLGGNAIQAMAEQVAAGQPAALTIRLETRTVDDRIARTHPPLRPGPGLLLTVRDNGPGIDAATRGRIFEPFFSTKGAGGTGLGLALVHSIVTQHDGNIAVDSTLGVGTSFRIWLPRIPDAPAVASVATPEERRRRHMLIVDDEPGIADVTALILTELGHDAEAFETVDEARKRVAAGAAFDLVIVDRGTLIRAGATSLEAARLCGPAVPVILMREAGEVNGIAGAESFGFLAKPFTPRQLRESCAEALGDC